MPFSVFNAHESCCEATRYQEKIIGYNMVPYTMLAPASQEIRKFYVVLPNISLLDFFMESYHPTMPLILLVTGKVDKWL